MDHREKPTELRKPDPGGDHGRKDGAHPCLFLSFISVPGRSLPEKSLTCLSVATMLGPVFSLYLIVVQNSEPCFSFTYVYLLSWATVICLCELICESRELQMAPTACVNYTRRSGQPSTLGHVRLLLRLLLSLTVTVLLMRSVICWGHFEDHVIFECYV